MTRGTTPTHTFTLPDNLKTATISTLYITYAQHGTTVLEKTLDDVTNNNGVLTCTLTQADTLAFEVLDQHCGCDKVDVQVRLKTSDGVVMASDIMPVPIRDILKDGEI